MQPSFDPTTDMDVRADAEARAKVHALMKDATFAMFGTYDAQGNAHARPMVASAHDDDAEGGALWFFTRHDSRKIAELQADGRVTLSYADPKAQNYVSAIGRAQIVRDRAKVQDLWSEPLRTWFPDGPSDESIALIRVELDRAEYWDSPSSAVVYAYGYAKARLTGEPPSPGDVAQVKM